MINFVICSMPDTFSNLYGLVEKYFMNYDVLYKCHHCSNYEESLDKFIKKKLGCKVYVFYKEIDGVTYFDAIDKVRNEYSDWSSLIIVIDSNNSYKHSVYCSDSFIFMYISEADHFIEKVNFTLDKCIKHYDGKSNSLKIRNYGYVEYILYEDIIYIEKVKDSKSCIIKTVYGDKKYTGSLSSLYEKLKYNKFIQTHQSFIINIHYLDKYIPGKNIIKLKNCDDVVGVSRKYKKSVNEIVNNK